MRKPITAADFREWVKSADAESLEVFIDETLNVILDLESDDFFGTEGLNKRFA